MNKLNWVRCALGMLSILMLVGCDQTTTQPAVTITTPTSAPQVEPRTTMTPTAIKTSPPALSSIASPSRASSAAGATGKTQVTPTATRTAASISTASVTTKASSASISTKTSKGTALDQALQDLEDSLNNADTLSNPP